MGIHKIEIEKGNEKVLSDVVQDTNKRLGFNFTKDDYLTWLMNNWFANKRGEGKAKNVKGNVGRDCKVGGEDCSICT